MQEQLGLHFLRRLAIRLGRHHPPELVNGTEELIERILRRSLLRAQHHHDHHRPVNTRSRVKSVACTRNRFQISAILTTASVGE